MFLSYNGVNFDLITLDRVDRTAVFSPDGTTVLYVEWAIAASVVYAPTIGPIGNSAHLGGTSTYFPSLNLRPDVIDVNTRVDPRGELPFVSTLVQPGPEQAILTDREILPRLLVPRKSLTIWGYDRNGNTLLWLQSPRLNPFDNTKILPRDAKNGPIIQAAPVVSSIGSGKLFGAQLEIKTWVTPCSNNSDRFILSHRWQMSHEYDDDFYLTRRVTGEAHFNGGIKDVFNERPDYLISQLFHPIPLGFRRLLGPVTRSPDGLVLRYSYTDTDQKVVFDPGKTGATQIEIVENVTYRTSHIDATEAVKALAAAKAGGKGK